MDNTIIKRVQISNIIHNTDDCRTIVLQPLDAWVPNYQSGQFITLVFYTRAGEKRRSYSISSSPHANEPLAITVKKLDNGEFSRWLVYKAKPGDILYTSGISGFFILPEVRENKTFCFLAAGSGITPCYSLIKTLLLTGNNQVYLIYSNRTEKDAIFLNELKALEEVHKQRLVIRYLFSYRLDVRHSRLSHWLLSHLLDMYFDKTVRQDLLFYVCGPFDYMLMADISLKNNGITKAQIYKEDFNPLPKLKLPEPPDKDAHTITLRIAGNSHKLMVQYPVSIVASAKAAKIAVPYSCEAGKCGSCVATCTSGNIWMAYNEVLTDAEIEKGKVLTCQGFAVGGDAEVVYS